MTIYERMRNVPRGSTPATFKRARKIEDLIGGTIGTSGNDDGFRFIDNELTFEQELPRCSRISSDMRK
jgi:hypothetical protein